MRKHDVAFCLEEKKLWGEKEKIRPVREREGERERERDGEKK